MSSPVPCINSHTLRSRDLIDHWSCDHILDWKGRPQGWLTDKRHLSKMSEQSNVSDSGYTEYTSPSLVSSKPISFASASKSASQNTIAKGAVMVSSKYHSPFDSIVLVTVSTRLLLFFCVGAGQPTFPAPTQKKSCDLATWDYSEYVLAMTIMSVAPQI